MIILLPLFFIHAASCSTKPGFRFEVTQKGVNYARDTLLPVVKNAIRTAKIPEITERVSTPVGWYDVNLYQTKITRVSIPHTSAEIVPPSSIDARVSGVSISLTGHWKYREEAWPHIGDAGTVDVTASVVDIGLVVDVGMTAQGEPMVSSQKCVFHIGKIDVKFHGGMAWLYNLFSSNIGDSVKGALKGQVCPLIRKEVDGDLNSALSTLDLTSNIDKYCYIDYTLVQPPFVGNHAIYMDGKGEIFDRASPTECDAEKQDLPTTVNPHSMVTLWVTEYMLNTAGFAYQTADCLQYNLTSHDIPKKIPITMDTGFFKYFLPSLYKAYPDKDLTLWIKVTKPVTFNITTEGVSGRAEGTIEWLVDTGNSTLASAFTLDAQLDLCVNISVQLGTTSAIYLDIISVEPYIQLRESNIGDFSINSLQRFLTFSRALIVPFVNSMLVRGIPLPSSEDIAFSGFDFTLQDGYLQIHTDVIYHPHGRYTASPTNYTLFNEYTCKSQQSSDDHWLYEIVDDVNTRLILNNTD